MGIISEEYWCESFNIIVSDMECNDCEIKECEHNPEYEDE